MHTSQIDRFRELIGADSVASVNDVDLSENIADLFDIVDVEIRRSADAIGQRILDLHLRRKMRFSEVAAEMGIDEASARRGWYRLLSRVADGVTEHLRSQDKVALAFWPLLEDPELVRLTILAFALPVSGPDEPATGLAELRVLRRAIETFGTHGDAVRWLLDECPALGAKPIDLVISAHGLSDVESVLGCIDHGIVF